MLAGLEPTRLAVRRSAGALILVVAPALSVSQFAGGLGANRGWRSRARARGQARQVEQTQREEGEAILGARRCGAWPESKPAPSDFAVRWQNDFVKAQRGTFVPFTLTVDASSLASARRWYMSGRFDGRRASPDRRRQEREPQPGGAEAAYPVDAIFPVDLMPRQPVFRTRRVEDQPRVFGRAGRVRGVSS